MLIPNLEDNLRFKVMPAFNTGYFTYNQSPKVFYLENFINRDECNLITTYCAEHQAHAVTELGVDNNSFQCYTWRISFYQSESLKNIAGRLAYLSGLPVSYAEQLEVRRFDNMGFYNSMCDHIEDSDHLAMFGNCAEFPTGAWEQIHTDGTKQLGPSGNRIHTAMVFLSDHDDVKVRYHNFNKPHMTPQQGTVMLYNVETDNIVYDITTNVSDKPFWMCKLMFRENPRKLA